MFCFLSDLKQRFHLSWYSLFLPNHAWLSLSFFQARNFKLEAKHQLYFSVGWWSSTSPRTSSGRTISKLFLQGDVGRGAGRQSGEIIHFLNNCVQKVFVFSSVFPWLWTIILPLKQLTVELQGIKTAERWDSVQLELHGVPGDVRGALTSSLALRLPQHGQEGGPGPVLG